MNLISMTWSVHSGQSPNFDHSWPSNRMVDDADLCLQFDLSYRLSSKSHDDIFDCNSRVTLFKSSSQMLHIMRTENAR
jgi:hypothetical protein